MSIENIIYKRVNVVFAKNDTYDLTIYYFKFNGKK